MATINTYDTPAKPPRRRGLSKRILLMLLLFVAVIAVVAYFKMQQINGFKAMSVAMKDPPQTVSSAKVSLQPWQPTLTAVGSLRAVNGVDLAFETSGIVDKLNFDSGYDVKQGQLLAGLRLNDEPGKLAALEAQKKLADITIARDKKQFAAQAVAQATIDADTANLLNFNAQITQIQSQIDEKQIKAPFSGHLGVRMVDLGQFLQAGTPIVTLQALDPIYVDFLLPQQSLEQLKVKSQVAIKVDTYPDQTFTGEISAINPKVDTQSRNIQVRATVKNPDHKLLPGMYATVDVANGTPQQFVTVPQTAITYNPYGDTVFTIVDSGKKNDKGQPILNAKQSFVTTGLTRGDQVAITKGLGDGDTIVTSGQMKLHNGSPLVINNAVQPSSDENPAPQEH